MKRPRPAPSPYVAMLDGWQLATVERLWTAVLASGALDEVIQWVHLVYLANGPVLLIRAEKHRVLFGFWRGKPLREIEPRLRAGGKYEMATLALHANDEASRRGASVFLPSCIAGSESRFDL